MIYNTFQDQQMIKFREYIPHSNCCLKKNWILESLFLSGSYYIFLICIKVHVTKYSCKINMVYLFGEQA